MRKPLLILVSGAPGAGKTTLAHKLAEYLRVPHIARDEVLRGLEMTLGRETDRKEQVSKLYYPLLVHMLKAEMSVVTDGTISRDLSEDDIKTFLVPNAQVVNIHARAANEHQRFIDRETQREGWSNDWVDAHLKHLDTIYPRTVEPLDLGIPLIEVDTTNGYAPSIPEVVSRIRKMYKDTRTGVQEGGER